MERRIAPQIAEDECRRGVRLGSYLTDRNRGFGPLRAYSAGMLVASRRDDTSQDGAPSPTRRAYLVAPAIAAAMLVATLIWGSRYGMGIRDPDGIIGWRFSFVIALVGGFWALDVIPRGILTARTNKASTWRTLVATARERWPWRRFAFVIGSIVAFYVTYLCYRNVKSYLPLARPRLLDGELADFERSLFGQDPSTLLHQLLGTGVSAQVLSTVYLLFLTFVPISVGVTLVWSSDRAGALWWVSVLSINWVLGALSYFVLPSMGPAFTEPHLFTALPETGTSMLQQTLMEDRHDVPRQPRGQRGAAEHRRVRLAAHLDRVRRGPDGAPAARAASDADRHVGLPGAHVPGDDLLRLALRGRRPRRLRDGLRVRLPRRRAHRMADRAQQGDRPAPAQERLTDARACTRVGRPWCR